MSFGDLNVKLHPARVNRALMNLARERERGNRHGRNERVFAMCRRGADDVLMMLRVLWDVAAMLW